MNLLGIRYRLVRIDRQLDINALRLLKLHRQIEAFIKRSVGPDYQVEDVTRE
jgi:hypothetical protein